ncbi:MAG: DNA alkylation repair protein [Candidatus Magnetomorum sp.]|nr:DNA alkylation repair protein [Candidatus Magnetomorum sp.]
MTSTRKEIHSAIRRHQDVQRATHCQNFFKTGKGEYGEGDLFLGVRVPELRKLSTTYKHISLDDAVYFLKSRYHEDRQFALFVLILQFKKAAPDIREKIYQVYLDHTRYINNWDLVDASAHQIVGYYLSDKDRSMLYDLVQSDDLWERRIAIIATFFFIKTNDFHDALKLSEILLPDTHDLIHKAVGWMLREIGKRDLKTEKTFLNKHYPNIPRTALRYAIEKFPEPERKKYLSGNHTDISVNVPAKHL